MTQVALEFLGMIPHVGPIGLFSEFTSMEAQSWARGELDR